MGKVVIAGSGPVGALTAIFLAKAGYNVDVFERRDCPESIPPPDDNRAYLLNLNLRSFAAFKDAGVATDILLKRCNGRSEFIFRDKKGRAVGGANMPVTTKDPTMIRVYRDEISRHLIDEARRLYPEAITFHFDAPISGVDFEKRVVSISGSKAPQEMQYDLLVAADGAGSVVRSELQKSMPPDFITRRTNTAVYATGPLKIRDHSKFPSHTFTAMDTFEEGAVMIYGRGQNDYRLGLFLDKEGSQRLKKGDDGWLQAYLDNTMPQLLNDARASAKDLASNPPDFSPVSGWTYLSQLHGPRNHSNLDAALPAYTKARLPDIKALTELNEIIARDRFAATISNQAHEGGSRELLHKVWLATHGVIISVQMARMGLHRKAPSIFPMPTMFKAVTGLTPFRKVMPAAYLDVAAIVLFGTALTGALCYSLRRR